MIRLFKIIAILLFIQPALANQTLIISKENIKPIDLLNPKRNDTLKVLDYFDKIPDTIQLWGCHGEFTYDLKVPKNDKYIIYISEEGFAMISINNKTIYLDRTAENKIPNKKSKLIFKGQGFKLTLTLRQKSEEYLITNYNGRLFLKDTNHTYIFKIIGRFAC